MRFTAIFPLLCTLVAFILSLLCIFAGSKTGYIEEADILTLNTSMLGRLTLNTSKNSNSLLNSIENSIKGEVNDLIADVAQALNIHDFYSAHLLNYCEGYYSPSPIANATVDPHKNVTRCSNHTAMFHFDPTSVIQKELKPGINLTDLQWPSAIKDAVHAVKVASSAMFVLYCIGVAAAGLALLGAFLGVFSGGRIAALANNGLALLAMMALGIASAIVSAIMSKVVHEVNKHGTDVGVTASKGKTFLGMTWAATGLMFVAAIAWIYEFVAFRRQQTSYVFEGKTGRLCQIIVNMGLKAVHFGGGNIGRGFVAEKLHLAGYEVVFVDVMDSIIEQLQKNKEYTVTEIGGEGEKVNTINNYRAINSKTHEADVIDEIATADLVTCAVGPNVLKFIAPVIAKAIDKRSVPKPIAVIACENAIGATDTLAGFIKDSKNTPQDRLSSVSDRARFANSAIDRIVPGQDPNAGLNVKIESFYEWVVDKTPFAEHGHPEVSAIKWVDDLNPYIERKLFTVNTGHAAAAYYGHARGKRTIHESLQDSEINKFVYECLAETSHLIVKKHGISVDEQKAYVDKIVKRISNPYLEDVVERVGRAPLRKLSRKERFIGPASQLVESGDKIDALLGAVEQAFAFVDVEGDEESVELSKILKSTGAKEVVGKVCGLEESHPLFSKIVPIVEKVQKGLK
ncbi:MAG: hypothetical protein LQ343_004493 [Gyalolechia ehrenbergii]|nr:MAG: hypothetical protein LQ343_004493 [Gyalolechia ehrenbergii]